MAESAEKEIDFDVIEFAQLLSVLPEHLTVSDEMEKADPQKKNHWWSSQREHMSSWFESQATTGSGSFTRQTPNHSARKTYNNLQHPEGIVWIAEALGADKTLLQNTANDALKIDRRKRSGYVRQYLPWKMIAELAKSQLESRRR